MSRGRDLTIQRGCVNLIVDDEGMRSARDGVSDESQVVTARGRVTMSESTARLVESNAMKKGDVLGAARYAAVQAAKSASAYLPLFHSVSSNVARVGFEIGNDFVEVRVDFPGQGLAARMPALTGATVAALAIFDMCKAVDRTMTIGPVECVEVEQTGDR